MFEIKSLISLSATKLEMYRDDLKLAHGTGFFYRFGDQYYLVSNRHNVTGRDQNTGVPLHTRGITPNLLKFRFPILVSIDGRLFVNYTESSSIRWSGEGTPWAEHPTFGSMVDVVCFRLRPGLLGDGLLISANQIPRSLSIALQPSMRVVVLGFPLGASVRESYPVWVTGSIASEPEIDVEDKPAMYIDCRTNRGSSGSPVFAYELGSLVEYHPIEGEPKPHMRVESAGGRNAGMFPHPVHKFIGIYSGRIRDGSDIGLVWRKTVIDEICAGHKLEGPVQ